MKLFHSILRPAASVRRFWIRELLPLFELRSDLDETGTTESVEKSIEFRGVGVWTLIFAILIASIGLNVNSTAVIIGAMLISPLMGPIVGAGFALGINDFDLLKKGLRNLVIATAVSVITSTLYFLLSPLAEAQSELLARTQPTIYDVLIALFGGATGIITGTRKERTIHAISGVAIATALMPPLCTAGFGLAHGHPHFFLSAIYLYLINSIFICLSTFVVVRTLRFKKHTFVDRVTEQRVTLYMSLFAVVVAIPSMYTAYGTVNDAVFRSRANKFLAESFQSSQSKILEKHLERRKEGNLIELTLIGKSLPESEKEKLRDRLGAYGLKGTTLTFNDTATGSLQELEARLSQNLKSDVLERLYREDRDAMKNKDEKIRLLEEELLKYKRSESLVEDVGLELGALSSRTHGLLISEMPSWSKGEGRNGLVTVVIVRWKGRASRAERLLAENFIRARLKNDKARIIHE